LAEEAAAKKEDARFYEEEMSTFSKRQKLRSMSLDELQVLKDELVAKAEEEAATNKAVPSKHE